jgi:biotin-[acetyl-CoA-carboxylase] ligase BirA-like protein
MILFTDTTSYSEAMIGRELQWGSHSRFAGNDPYSLLLKRLIPGTVSQAKTYLPGPWEYCFLAEEAAESQFDVLAELGSAEKTMRGNILCCAGSGKGFHGQQGREWIACNGNLHVSVLFRPNQRLANCGIGFIALGVVSVLQTLDKLGYRGAKVKWVNDIMMGSSKVGGILAHVKTQGEFVTTALLGIGLNIETRPEVKATRFVREVAAVNDLVGEHRRSTADRAFRKLVAILAENYERLLSGQTAGFIDRYRERSTVLGKQVTVFEDGEETEQEIARGRVHAIGDNLELIMEAGGTRVWRGRLIEE